MIISGGFHKSPSIKFPMNIKIIWQDKRILLLTAFLLLLFLSGILSPILIKNRKSDWETILKQKTETAEFYIQNDIDKKINKLITVTYSLKNSFRKDFSTNNFSDVQYDFSSLKLKSFSMEAVNDSELVYWHGKQILKFPELFINNYPFGEVCFKTNKLITYLAVSDTIRIKNRVYYLTFGIPVEDQSELTPEENNNYNLSIRLSKTIFIEFLSVVE